MTRSFDPHDYSHGGPRRSRPAFSIPSILAVACAIGSFATGAFLGFIFAIGAIILGLVGVVLALAPGIRGGLISAVSIGLGLIGILAAVFKLVF